MKKLYTMMLLFFALAISAQDGALDASFGTNGIQIVPTISYLNDMTTDSNGKIIISGGQNGNILIYRYNTDGTLDNTFENDGMKEIALGTSLSNGVSVAVDSNNNIFIATNFYGKIIKLNAIDGSFDNSFGVNGIATYQTDYDKYVKVAIDFNNKIVVCSYQTASSNYNYLNVIQRLNQDGTYDVSFNSGNQVEFYNGASEPCFVNGLQIQNDNKIIVSITESSFIPYSHAIRRFNANGTLDTTFSTGSTGISTNGFSKNISFDGSNLYALASNPAPGVLNTATVIKYNSNGTKDATFDTDGIVNLIFNSQYYNEPNGICVQPDGKKIVVASTRLTSSTANSNLALARLNLDGSFDATFGNNGQTLVPLNTVSRPKSWSLLNYSNGKVYSLINNGANIALYRFNTGITLNNSSFFQAKNKIILYPNPTATTLNIQSNTTITSIKIIDITGRSTTPTFENNKINVSNLANCVYLIEATTENGIVREKFIKN